FHRNRALNARNFFQADTTPLVQNQFGGTMGGPIRKDKTFFFGTYQGFRRRTQDFRMNALVPTAAERSRDFSRTVGRDGQLIIIRDPVTGQAFFGNVIPPDRLSPVALNYLNLAIPLPNDPAQGPNALRQAASEPTDNGQYLGKIDHLISEKHKISAAYFISKSVVEDHFLKDIDFAVNSTISRQQNANIHEYWTISPTKLNHFRATLSRTAGNSKISPNNVTLNELGSQFSPLSEGPTMPPSFNVSGYFDAGTTFGGPKTSNNYAVADHFDWIKGRHNFKFGGELWLRRLFDVSASPAMGGEFIFEGQTANPNSTGNSLADLLLGRVQQLTLGAQSYKSNNAWAYYGFLQDNFKVTSRLALTLGLRYELDTWPVHPADQLIAYIPGRQSTCVPQAPPSIVFPCDAGVPRAGVKNDTNNFAPRFGIAYDLSGNGKSVLRAGYGISYAFPIFNTLQGQQVSTPFAFGRRVIRDTTLADPFAPIGGSPYPFRKDPSNLKFPASSNYNFQDFNMRTGYSQQYNLSWQQQIGTDWMIDLAYVGNVNRKLAGTFDINSPILTPDAGSNNIDQRRPFFPMFKQLTESGAFVDSSYNALQARLEKRFSQGLTLLGSYTFGKTIDLQSWHDSQTFWLDPRNLGLDKGRADFDRTHALAVSWVWELPVSTQAKGVVSRIFGGWAMNGIATFYSGEPVPILTDKDNDFDGNARNDRPDVVGDWNLSSNRSRAETIKAWFNPDAFLANTAGQRGHFGRNVVIGPNSGNVDLGLLKKFRIREGQHLEFRFDVFNVFNLVNLGAFHADARSTGGVEGRVSRSTFGQIISAGDPRIIQLGLKYYF
ncbi:MAG: hypothetical protein DMG05_22015, partial [Acidobacteria bacterium]